MTANAKLRADAEALYGEGRLEDALRLYRHAAERRPDDPELLSDMGTVLFALDRPDDAARMYLEALELDDHCAAARQNLDALSRATGRTMEDLVARVREARRSPLVTALLLNYRRPENMQALLDCLAAQSVPVEVLLWNNGEPFTVSHREGAEPVPPSEHPLVTLAVRSSENVGCWTRWLLASAARTEYVCTLDDDLVLADRWVLEDAVWASRTRCPDGVVGLFGWTEVPGRDYRHCTHTNGSERDCRVDLIKGRFMLLRQALLERVPLEHPVFRELNDYRWRADDIYVNLCVSHGRRAAHLVPGILGKRFEELPGAERGLCRQPDHHRQRGELARRLFAHYEEVREAPEPPAPRTPARQTAAAAPAPAEETGERELPRQMELLAEADWDVLVVLDACRADYFGQVVGRGETVLSPGNCTRFWLPRMAEMLTERDVLYFTANPVVDREAERYGFDLDLVSIWRDQWGRFTERDIPSVHPLSVNGVVAAYGRLGRLDGRPFVVHYLQPHSPYIGTPPLAAARWGQGGGGFGAACRDLDRPDHAAARGELDWDVVRRAYAGNLALVWDAVRNLVASPVCEGRTVVVTSDHGEILGEHGGQFGHLGTWRYREQYEVPYLVMEGRPDEETTVKDKLAALGYA
ncbi:MAG: tetratricopeptide repeat protein [Candidatus Brocadiia bacterium]